MNNIITAKVIRVPGAVSEIGLEEGSTVGDALNAANEHPSDNEVVNLNGNKAELSTTLKDGDRIVIAKGAKGAFS